jgi:hypothetical protein
MLRNERSVPVLGAPFHKNVWGGMDIKLHELLV